MGKYANYDSKDQIIFIDLTGVMLTREIVDQIKAEILAAAKTTPKKLFAVACWKDAKVDPNAADYYGQQTSEVLTHLHGMVRYNTNNALTNITIRTQTVKRHWQGSQSLIYSSKEEALAAVRKKEKELDENEKEKTK